MKCAYGGDTGSRLWRIALIPESASTPVFKVLLVHFTQRETEVFPPCKPSLCGVSRLFPRLVMWSACAATWVGGLAYFTTEVVVVLRADMPSSLQHGADDLVG